MFFITFEGLDYSGKTTIIEMVNNELKNKKYKTLITREPGGDSISEKIRKIILSKYNKHMDYWTEALLYIASRSQHLKETIIPALNDKKIVLCDRFLDSTTAYQGSGRNISLEELDKVQKIIIKDNLPNLTIYLDITIETMIARQKTRNEKEKNRLDLEKIEFYQNVKKGYDKLTVNNKRFVKVNANLPIQIVFQNCYNIITKYLEKL